ncbi:MAG: oligosaccharide flippase family protein [Ignavibacteriae bacterium]|nr:hypothetical protein [Ignavibacteriota bacterium]NOG97403.1 oligosaccharide flippase family protein [Ignavibacteriota bacterium]
MKITKNTQNIFYLFSLDFIVRLFGFFATAYLARTLGKEGFGLINIGLGILSYALIISIGGLNLLGVRKVAAGEPDLSFLTSKIILLRLLLSFLVFILFAVIIYFLFDAISFTVSLMYLIYLFPAALLIEWYFQGKQRMGNIAAGKALGMGAYLILVLILIQSPDDILFTPIAWAFGVLINAVFLFMMAAESDRPLLKNILKIDSLGLLKESLPLAGASIIAQIVIMFPVIFIGITIGNADAGIYSAAFKIIVLILVLDRVFNALFFPKIVNHLNHMPDKVEDIFKTVLKIICFASTSIALIVLLIGEPVILLVFGEEYLSSVPLFQYLIGYFVLTLINSVFTYTLIGMHKEKVYTISLALGAAMFFVFGITITMIIGTVGMAIGLVIFELSALTYMVLNLKEIKYSIVRTIIIPLLFTFLTAASLVELLHLSLMAELLITFTAIILLAFTIKIGKREFNFFKQVLF